MVTSDRDITRERILAIALDRFIEKGYEATSLREIAEEMGFSKAALYYHFASKADLLMALHLRLQEITSRALAHLGPGPVEPEDWQRFLDQAVEDMLANRKLFIVHERNRAAFDEIQQQYPHEQPELDQRVRAIWADPSVDTQKRFRMAASFVAAMSSAMLVGDIFSHLSTEQARTMIHNIVGDILAPLHTPAGSR
jgi:AcrR family transcriptional regulator